MWTVIEKLFFAFYNAWVLSFKTRQIRSVTINFRIPSSLRVLNQRSTLHGSTSVPVSQKQNEKQEIIEKYPLMDTKFDEYKIAYQYRRNYELLRGYLVYLMFSIDTFVTNQDKVWIRFNENCFRNSSLIQKCCLILHFYLKFM